MKSLTGSVFLSRPRYTILVVDDDPEILRILESPLVRDGHGVHLAENGAQALSYLQRKRVDLILSDVDMPSMNGYELVRLVKEDPNTAEIPFLFFSAHDDISDRLKGLELGANDYISKPFLPKEVCLRVRNVLGQQAKRVERQASVMVAALDLIQLGIVVVSDREEVTMANGTARKILEQKDGLYLLKNKLCASTVAETRRIEALISEARSLANRFDPSKINPIRLRRPSLRRDFALIALPLDIGETLNIEVSVIGIVIHDPETTNTPSVELLINTYSFTKAEAKVASLLIQGKSISEICDELEVSRNTVCTHLKKLYVKTDTQRQSEFTHFLLQGLPQLKLNRE